MIFQNPNSTPLWLLLIMSAISVFGYPRIKKMVSRHTGDPVRQNIYSLIILSAIIAIVITISVIIE